jgi:hypothetical protein
MIDHLSSLWSRLTGKPPKIPEPVDTPSAEKILKKVGTEMHKKLHSTYASLALAYIVEECQKKDFETPQIAYLLWVLYKSQKTWPTVDRHQKRCLVFFLNLIVRAGKLPNYKTVIEPQDGETELQINEIIKTLAKRSIDLKQIVFSGLVDILKKYQKEWTSLHSETASKDMLGYFSYSFGDQAKNRWTLWGGEPGDTLRQYALLNY